MILVQSQHRRLQLLLFLPVQVSPRSTLYLLKLLPGSCSEGGGSNLLVAPVLHQLDTPTCAAAFRACGRALFPVVTHMNSGRLKEKQQYEVPSLALTQILLSKSFCLRAHGTIFKTPVCPGGAVGSLLPSSFFLKRSALKSQEAELCPS